MDNSDIKYEEKIEKLILVPCVICERIMKMQWLNVKDAYPCTLIINQNIMGNTGLVAMPLPVPAYLCAKHYEEMEKGGVALV